MAWKPMTSSSSRELAHRAIPVTLTPRHHTVRGEDWRAWFMFTQMIRAVHNGRFSLAAAFEPFTPMTRNFK